jgi:sulfite reductase alpha subunit-like flavoprotein
MGKNLDKRFEELGAKRFLKLQCLDDAVEDETNIDDFIKNITEFLESEIKLNTKIQNE